MRSAPVKRSKYTVSAPNARDFILIPTLKVQPKVQMRKLSEVLSLLDKNNKACLRCLKPVIELHLETNPPSKSPVNFGMRLQMH